MQGVGTGEVLEEGGGRGRGVREEDALLSLAVMRFPKHLISSIFLYPHGQNEIHCLLGSRQILNVVWNKNKRAASQIVRHFK